MRILILGGNGMLGHELLRSYAKAHDVKVTMRGNPEEYVTARLFKKDNTFTGVDVCAIDKLETILREFSPDAVINAVGIIKQRDNVTSYVPCIEINALFPHKLSAICGKIGSRLVHISTDCIFSGKKGNYSEDDFADANDLYGRSKFLGEVKDRHCITLRTSIIGLELQHKKSLIEWFLSQSGEIKGFRKAIYTGLTTIEIARVIEDILLEYTDLSGIYHVASAPISKFELLSKLAIYLNRNDIVIKPDDEFVSDRSLNATHFKLETGYIAPAWDKMLSELADMIIMREKGRTA